MQISKGNCNVDDQKQLYSITNLFQNGSFESNQYFLPVSTTSSYITGVSIINTGLFGTNSLINYHGDIHSAYYTDGQMVDAIANHKYYASNWMYKENKGDGYCYADMAWVYGSDVDANHWVGIANQDNINIWENLSVIHTAPDFSTKINFAISDTTSNNHQQICYADGILLIDLTAPFGSGNEPSKEWCDENLQYFDGTKTFYLNRP